MASIIHEKQNLLHLRWDEARKSSGTAGSFLKAYSDLGGKKTYYKLSNYDAYKGVVGHECVNEIIVDRLLTFLGVEHLSYQLIHADIFVGGRTLETYLCASEDFKRKGDSKVALDSYYQANKDGGESPMDFCLRMGWERYVYEMLAVDFLILNRDRHGANIEVLKNSHDRTVRLAPLFDHGLSFLCRCSSDAEVDAFDPMADKPVQCFVGSNSTQKNLEIIPKDRMPAFRIPKESDRIALFDGLAPILPQKWLDKIWEMLRRRWNCYEALRGTR